MARLLSIRIEFHDAPFLQKGVGYSTTICLVEPTEIFAEMT